MFQAEGWDLAIHGEACHLGTYFSNAKLWIDFLNKFLRHILISDLPNYANKTKWDGGIKLLLEFSCNIARKQKFQYMKTGIIS